MMPKLGFEMLCVALGAGATAASLWALGGVARRRKRWLDLPSDDMLKSHAEPVPLVGGLGLWLGLIVAGLSMLIAGRGIVTLSVSVVSGLPIALGWADDVYWKNDPARYRPRTKFAIQVLVSILCGVAIWAFGWGDGIGLHAVLAIPVLAFLAFGAMNATNMQDGSDGIAAALALVSSAFYAGLLGWANDAEGFWLAASTAAVLLVFFLYNKPPAKVYLGDNGSHWIGFVLIALAARLAVRLGGGWWLLVTPAILGVAILDAGLTVVRRIVSHERLFLGDRGHLYDRLAASGLTKSGTLTVYTLLHLGIAGLVTFAIVLITQG